MNPPGEPYPTQTTINMSKAFIVTGASRGLGVAIAQLLLRAGHKVFLVARSEAGLQQIKAEHPSSVEYMAADLANLDVRC
jgi:short-subunit dehydrogenase